MEWLGGGGIVVVVLGLGATLIGLVTIIWHVRDDRRRTVGLRIQYSGMAAASLGMSLFMVSRPAEILPSPLNILSAVLLFALSLRLATAAAFLKPPHRWVAS